MEVTEFKSFFEGSSAKCFRALCDDGKDWVIRCKKKNKNSKRLFSEYVAGKLAIEFGINRPDCKVVKIPNTFMKKLNGFENIFDENCSYGVATLFINNLNSFKPPKTKSYLDKDFSKINFDFITKEMSGVKNFEQIYALKVFSHWIYLSDYHKYENLKITQDKKIVFLDFDLSFESNEGSWGRMPDYSYIKIKLHSCIDHRCHIVFLNIFNKSNSGGCSGLKCSYLFLN